MDNLSPSPESPVNREEKKQKQAERDRREARRRKLTPLLRFAGIGLIIIGVIGGLVWIGEMQDTDTAQPSPISGEVTSIDHIKGPENARVTVIEYADFQCPTCAAYAPVIEQLHDDYPDDLKVVYRYFPLQTIHPNATLAAQAAQAASLQGKFWEYHDLLFSRQSDWSDDNKAKEKFLSYAQELGLNVDQFTTDLDSKETKNRVNADYRSGLSAGVQGTPTFFLNGQPLENPRGYEAFKKAIDDKLQP
jgi:formate-nitrite transporter family protein